MQRLSTKSPLDKILDGGIEHAAVTNVYGEAGSGKSNLALLCTISVIEQGKKVIFIDTEGGFSFDRFDQLTNGRSHEYLSKVILLEPKNWEEQCKRIDELEKLVTNDVGLIVIDSIVTLYRLVLNDENYPQVNRELSSQYAKLSSIAREKNIPVLVTNQVYSISGKLELISRTIGKYWAKALIKLEKLDRPNHRLATIVKHRSIPEGKSIEFEITRNGFKEVGRLSIF
ncbi:MAG: DNA repair and recombination protein RadB [Candidatus Aenigmarchaeota archaeon]|nr:DNA repair and recombination protein RadB [Candidatus Aenigmarchaeota archaeon]